MDTIIHFSVPFLSTHLTATLLHPQHWLVVYYCLHQMFCCFSEETRLQVLLLLKFNYSG